MSGAAPGGDAATAARPRDPALVIAVVALAGATLALLVIAAGNVVAALVPIASALFLIMLLRAPLRWMCTGLIFLGLVGENPYEAFALMRFQTFWAPIGYALLGNLKIVTGISALSFTGTDVLVLLLFLTMVYRRATGAHIDDHGPYRTPRPMSLAALAQIGGICLLWAYGLATGGDLTSSLWQVHQILFIPLMFLLFQAVYRGSHDARVIARTFLAAATVRALLSIFIYYTVTMPDGSRLPYQTTHHDTVLYVVAFSYLVATQNEGAGKGRWLQRLGAAAILLGGMITNQRRLLWISLTAAMTILFLISPWTVLKRRLVRILVVSLPLMVLYVAVGWNQTGGIFGPVHIVRSVLDSKSDESSEWRDLENSNLVRNVQDRPLLGTGFGHEYIEYIPLPTVADSYAMFRYVPHNSVLGLWAFTGLFGFTLLWPLLVLGVFFAARAYRLSGVPRDRAFLVLTIVTVFAYLNQAYGDIVINSWIGPYLLAPVLALTGKLAAASGAWPARRASAASRDLAAMPSTRVRVDPPPFASPGTAS